MSLFFPSLFSPLYDYPYLVERHKHHRLSLSDICIAPLSCNVHSLVTSLVSWNGRRIISNNPLPLQHDGSSMQSYLVATLKVSILVLEMRMMEPQSFTFRNESKSAQIGDWCRSYNKDKDSKDDRGSRCTT